MWILGWVGMVGELIIGHKRADSAMLIFTSSPGGFCVENHWVRLPAWSLKAHNLGMVLTFIHIQLETLMLIQTLAHRPDY